MRWKTIRWCVAAALFLLGESQIRGDASDTTHDQQLTQEKLSSRFSFNLTQDEPARLDLEASAPGTDWSDRGSESAVISVFVDGHYLLDVVLWGGSQPTDYRLSLGELTAGHHKLLIQYSPTKSAGVPKKIKIASAAVTPVSAKDPVHDAVNNYAPILIGRDGLDNNHTDTPLALWYQTRPNSDNTTTITYGYVFSNEDGGTAADPNLEQARWGRMTDIQRVFEVTVDAQGHRVREVYEGLNHVDHPFQGVHDGTHAVIITAALNNDVADQGDGPLRFRLMPDFELRVDQPLGDLMRQNPQWFKIQQKELEREGKIGDSVSTTQMLDPRQYLYVQYNAVDADGGGVAARVTLKDGKQFFSDSNKPGVALSADGWNQAAVDLPPGTAIGDITNVDFVARGDGRGQVIQLGHVFMLDKNFRIVERRVQ